MQDTFFQPLMAGNGGCGEGGGTGSESAAENDLQHSGTVTTEKQAKFGNLGRGNKLSFKAIA